MASRPTPPTKRRRGPSAPVLVGAGIALLAPILVGIILVTLAVTRQLNRTPEAAAAFTVAATVSASPAATTTHTPTAPSGSALDVPVPATPDTPTPSATPPTLATATITSTIVPTATVTVASTGAITPSLTPTPTGSASPGPTPSVSASAATDTPPLTPATATTAATVSLTPAIRKDQGCIEPLTNDLYIYGELVNGSNVGMRITGFNVMVTWDGGQQTWDNVYFEIPGEAKLAPNQALPFLSIVGVNRSNFQSYTLQPIFETANWTPRTDLRVDEFVPVEQADAIDVAVKWTNTGTSTPNSVTVYAVAYDNQNRIASLDYRYIISKTQLGPGQHSAQLFIDKTEACGAGVAVREVLIFGE